MLTKCVYYRPEHRAKRGPLKLDFEGLGMQRWNKLIDRAQEVDEKKCVHFFSYHVHLQSNDY